jgi:hypothetical protein
MLVTDDIAEMTVGLIEDVLSGDISPAVGNTVCSATGNLLRMITLKHKYGRPAATRAEGKVLPLSA